MLVQVALRGNRLDTGVPLNRCRRLHRIAAACPASSLTTDLADSARRLITQIDLLRQPSDLDLLIFFARHPRALLASEQLTAFLGCAPNDMAASLERLVDAGLITRRLTRGKAARLYELPLEPPSAGGWLPALLELASTRAGRLAMVDELRQRSAEHESRRRFAEKANEVARHEVIVEAGSSRVFSSERQQSSATDLPTPQAFDNRHTRKSSPKS